MKTKRPGVQRYSIVLTDQAHKIVVAEADRQGRSMARQVEIIVDEWLTHHKLIKPVVKQEGENK